VVRVALRRPATAVDTGATKLLIGLDQRAMAERTLAIYFGQLLLILNYKCYWYQAISRWIQID